MHWDCSTSDDEAWPDVETQAATAQAVLNARPFDRVIVVLPDPESAWGLIAACCERHLPLVLFFQLCSEDFAVPHGVGDLLRSSHSQGHVVFVSVCREAVPRLARGLGVGDADIRTIRNASGQSWGFTTTAITARARSTASERGGTMLSVGRVSVQKGYPVLVRAALTVIKVRPDARFVWVGDGEELHVLRGLVHSSGLSRCFELAGWRDDIGSLLGSADVFVHPAVWEGTPLAISEAMAAGLPIVASCVGGIPEMLSEREAWLVQPGDSAAVSAAVIEALGNPVLARTKGENARARWLYEAALADSLLVALIADRWR